MLVVLKGVRFEIRQSHDLQSIIVVVLSLAISTYIERSLSRSELIHIRTLILFYFFSTSFRFASAYISNN
jgi:hypothetical protein